MWRSPATIFLDHMIIDKDVQVYTNCEMYIEMLKGKKLTKITFYYGILNFKGIAI